MSNITDLSKESNPVNPQADQVCSGFSLILPIYNEEAGLVATLDHLQQAFHRMNCPYEIIAVNDGSTDRTSELLQTRREIRVIEHLINRGYGAALKTGIRHAKYSLIVITDADGTYPNEMIPRLVALAQSVDMVVGARIGANVDYSPLRKIPKWFLVRFAEWITDSRIPDLNSGLRVFHKQSMEKFLKILPDSFSFTTTITVAMLTNNYVVRYEPIDFYSRKGKSKIKPIRDTLRFVQLILRTGLYFAPLKVFLPIAGVFFSGFLFTLVQDLFVREDLTERTLILLIAATQMGMFALLADMLDKRT
ncbi:MAG: glycosyltransferase family 2 protein [Oscillatoriales cyanobacterium RM1_1_9]|nr:glycosyltransferase family 2 protein [Oscillatoriales cyanobacterium SM2_3_0]NJO44207.1 glycosyltransferase family 2 protein [Oscillatoriales cyanobacterium RM2_1_1]NJO71205.1 glycosyltransferase family 2 protein [Oscillatoriales cyanobacterium RM1_1_9]